MSKSQSKRSLGDNPLKQNSAANGVSLNGTLHEQRLALLTNFGNIPALSLSLRYHNVERRMQNLRREGIYSMLVGRFSMMRCLSTPPTRIRFFRKLDLFTRESLLQQRNFTQSCIGARYVSRHCSCIREVDLMVAVNLAAIIPFILLDAAILLRKKATITGSIIWKGIQVTILTMYPFFILKPN